MNKAHALFKATGELSKGIDTYSTARLELGKYDSVRLSDQIEELIPKGYSGYVEVEVHIRELEPPRRVLLFEGLPSPVQQEEAVNVAT